MEACKFIIFCKYTSHNSDQAKLKQKMPFTQNILTLVAFWQRQNSVSLVTLVL